MQYRQLGHAGPQVSEIGFGGWALGGQWGRQDDADSIAALHRAIDLGVNLIDTAAGYGEGRSEKVIAEVVKQRSEKLFIATKTPPAEGPWPPSPYCAWQDRYSANYLRENVEQRLRNLQTERIDLLQLHTWTRAWNDDPQPLLVLRKLCEEGKIGMIGISTPEQDQNCVIQLMRDGLVDCVQVIFNLFDQEPAAQLLPVAAETGTGVIVRVALDEGMLAGKYTAEDRFAEDDFRHQYFAGDRLQRSVDRVTAIDSDMQRFGLRDYSQADLAIKFSLTATGVSSVITGIRSAEQAEQNAAVSDKPAIPDTLLHLLRRHNWRRGVWYAGK
ncbi:General stress protein 69 [Rosistilla carotiformis]|uniref:General stress protein 69 n=1 Tax=Rosistilla carotiformis TaxID=2528017 RepID=A0A518JQE8_9BACT|nr:aldo/keto reductase [Rosistilla carotiformis]QDV67763.1 General stress protein 69 [Rosistilla carotiformis]